jgi:Ca2+-dependent lipid-binding protein
MDTQEHVVPSGQHYSGHNRVPNIQEFVQRLDREKRERDAAIDNDVRQSNKNKTSDAQDHKQNDQNIRKRHNARKVRDPVTGKDVYIADADISYKDAVDNPIMSVPNENLGKDTTVRVGSDQSGEEYRHNQDITAPPDPVQEGSTSDVPIRSEKTSVTFYKTPSVSYEPMFALFEQRANMLCAGIFAGIVVVGKILGASLWGLFPLGACIASGVFLWIKDLIKHGRDVEWKSEQDRGEAATANLIPESVEVCDTTMLLQTTSLLTPTVD